jgi:large conductance mechanosensitive channel
MRALDLYCRPDDRAKRRNRRRSEKMLKDFKAFINKGNVVDLAVAVIIGAAFGKIVLSLTDDIIMPVIGKIFRRARFLELFHALGSIPADFAGSLASYADLKKAGVPLIGLRPVHHRRRSIS